MEGLSEVAGGAVGGPAESDPVADNIATAKAMASHVGAALAADWLTRQVPGITLEQAADHIAAK